MSKKIGLLTFHRTTNFGSSLQCFGLYKAIKNLNYNCEVIDYRCPSVENRERLKIKFNTFNPKAIVKILIFQPIYNKKAKSLSRFNHEKINMSIPYYPNNIKDSEKEYDKILVGSDIVWGRDITQDDYNYFLEFVSDKKKKYAFSSSVGNYDIRKDETKLSNLLNDFNKIAVREDDAIKWIKKISNVDADLVCDPTMLLTKEEWEEEIPTQKKYDNYILVYFNSDNSKCLNDAIAYGKKVGKRVVFINYDKPLKGIINSMPTTLKEFLGLIKYADMVFTASYHGMLFSLYYNVEMMFYTRNHSSRVLSLARKLGILDHCGDDWDATNYKKINYNDVNIKIKEFRNHSLKILKNILED